MSLCRNAKGVGDGVKAKETTLPVIFVLLERATSETTLVARSNSIYNYNKWL